jgi:uncharacterized protein (DUF39 family)
LLRHAYEHKCVIHKQENEQILEHRVLLDEQIDAELVNKSLDFHRALRFITVFTTACHWSLSSGKIVYEGKLGVKDSI